MENKFRALLEAGKPTTSTRIWSTWPFYTETIAATGNFDYVEFVGEYAPFTQADLENICRAAELHNMASMMKVDFQNRHYVAQKAIAAGFQAILFADHHTPDEVRESIQMISADSPERHGRYGFPNRRFIGTSPYMTQTEHAQCLNRIVKAFMIEKQEAVDQIEEICAVPGVDMIQFGPNDYCLSNGWNKEGDHAKAAKEAERKCIEAALRHGVRPRCEINKPEEADYYISLGVKDFSLGDQLRILKGYWNGEGKMLRKIADGLS